MQKQSLLLFLLLTFIPILVSAKNSMPPPAVEITTVETSNWQSDINAIGTLSANQGVTIKPQISGQIIAVYFRSGDHVKANTPLIQIDPAIAKSTLDGAKAKLMLSKANYLRTATLFKKHVFAQADLDNALATYRSNLADVTKARAQLNETLLTAPFDGRLGLRQVDRGDYVSPGNTITTLDDINPLRVDFKVPEVYLGRLQVGDTVLIHSSAYPKKTFKGKIYALDSQIDPNTRSLGVRAVLPNPDEKLLPGAFVDVKIETGKPQKWVTVPETAILYDAKGQYVYRVIKKLPVKTPVIIGPRKNGMLAITSGLQSGDEVITTGAFKVVAGEPVMPVK
jgi:membrane fusion protein (multidrug efflux system)